MNTEVELLRSVYMSECEHDVCPSSICFLMFILAYLFAY